MKTKTRTICLAFALLFVCGATAVAAPRARRQVAGGSNAQKTNTAKTVERTRYRINLKLDFDARSYTGSERVRWINQDSRPASVLYFHLYPNLRGDESTTTTTTLTTARDEFPRASTAPAEAQTAPYEPRLEVTEVRSVQTAQALAFSLEDAGVTLRVQLREAVAGSGGAVEIEIRFKGSVPEIDADETSLSAHVVQQVGAALRDTRETRRSRDTNFSARGVMLLGSFYPVLAVRDGNDWQRKTEASVGDVMHTDVADYDVTIETLPAVALFTSGESAGGRNPGGDSTGAPVLRDFEGSGLRSFAVVAGRSLRSSEQNVSGLRVRSVYTADHEKVGQRVLGVAAEAVRTFVSRFGALPFKTVMVTEAPLVAGLGSSDFAGLGVIASAFYVDFDSPAMRNLPELVREQRASVEDSLEFTVAHTIAHQWWGATVGNDPQRAPIMDEALAHWSALLYYLDVHGKERAALVQEDQLRGVYQVYRTFGGEDMAAERGAREYRNSFQYAAIVASKGALMFAELRQLLGDERFFAALRNYYEANRLEVAELEDLRGAFIAEAPLAERRAVTRTFNRWLAEKHGDEDIAPPNPQLAAALGLSTEASVPRDRNAFSRLGRFFWRQMTRIR
ncbi:MAG TPA: M1 family aminopeptidase [Pyrinomonadaceae bacterium]|nr:M1 family aminopeptidase [Pyrinomonadaceae bacterium]